MLERLSITLAKIFDFSSKSDILFSQKWINTIIDKNQKHALFLISTDNSLRLIPTMSDKAIKFYIELDSILDNLLQNILVLLSRLNIKPLYNSGVCFAESVCYLEIFIDFIADKNLLKTLTENLEEFTGNSKVVMEVIEL